MASNTEAIVWHETNQVKYVGIRPGYDGLHVTADGVISNDTLVIYTVPADKTLLIFNDWIRGDMSVAAWVNCYLWLRDAVPANVYKMYHLSLYGTATSEGRSIARFVPLIAPTGYSIALIGNSVSCSVTAGIEGILVDA